ncbi:MAG: Nif3-like dinuclear metal center hexameric protein [Sphingobacteriia bacterium]|nr:MAG: Nif3-like dinuclear metal center hexameric protein [Sphingobacteriia bacterium]
MPSSQPGPSCQDIIQSLESLAPLAFQETYDNSGFIVGDPQSTCTGVLCTLDATEEVIEEAIAKGVNLVVAHHPILFKATKGLTGKNYAEKALIKAIQNKVVLYAIHTNLDNVMGGVNSRMAMALGLVDTQVLQPRKDLLHLLITYVPEAYLAPVQSALFAAGAGEIGQYSACSFHSPGTGGFTGSNQSNPFVGEPGKAHTEKEERVEVLVPRHLEKKVLKALHNAHPYEEVAYYLIPVNNAHSTVGSGLMGRLPTPLLEQDWLKKVQACFGLKALQHSPLLGKPVQKVALCGGSGSFLSGAARAAGADVFLTADVKYHEFFDAENQLVITSIGHWESEQFTIDLLFEHLQAKFPTFAVLKSTTVTNPVAYFMG